jgi:hypothetical protein
MMASLEPVVSLITESEWCCQFREELEIDRTFPGWMRAFRGLALGFAGLVFVVGTFVAVVLLCVTFGDAW